jgi:hypothetical protein
MPTTNTNLASSLWAQPVRTPAQAEEAKLEVDEQVRLDLGLASHPFTVQAMHPKGRHLHPLRLDRYAAAASGEPARHGERLAGGGSFGSGRTQFITNRRSPGTSAWFELSIALPRSPVITASCKRGYRQR